MPNLTLEINSLTRHLNLKRNRKLRMRWRVN